jgi:hypothetical protein
VAGGRDTGACAAGRAAVAASIATIALDHLLPAADMVAPLNAKRLT